MNAEDFYYKEKCEDSEKYDKTPIDNWWFGEHEMILFAEEYHKAKLKLLNIDSVVGQSEQLFCETCNKYDSCKYLCPPTMPACKIYGAK